MSSDAAILLVDDDQDVCASLADVLTDCGFQVHTALNGNSALRLLRDRAFHVALLDYSMPDMNGLELYHQIQQLRPGLVGVFITAYADTELMDEVRAAGVEHIFAKPVDFTKLFALLEGQIGRPA